MAFQVTALYAALLGLMVIVLANMVSAQRGRAKVSINDGSDPQLGLAIRRHGNLVENLPVALILMGLSEARGLDPMWLHVIGVVLVIARLSHAVGLNSAGRPTPLRMIGVLGTQLPMLVMIVYLLWSQF